MDKQVSCELMNPWLPKKSPTARKSNYSNCTNTHSIRQNKTLTSEASWFDSILNRYNQHLSFKVQVFFPEHFLVFYNQLIEWEMVHYICWGSSCGTTVLSRSQDAEAFVNCHSRSECNDPNDELCLSPDDGVCAVAAWYGRGLLARRAEDLQRRVDVHLRRVFDGELHHLGGDQRSLTLRVVC